MLRALRIASRAVETIAECGYVDPADPDATVASAKLIGETGLLLLVAARVRDADAELSVAIETLADRLAPHARGRTMQMGLCLHPSLAQDYAYGHICLTAIDRPDPSFERLLSASLEAAEAVSRERPPHRELEQRWLARLRQGGSGPSSEGPIYARMSALGRPLGAIRPARDDLYAFTHALMFAADFGREPLVSPRPVRAILADVEAALSRCLDVEDYDLAGELLLAWPLLGAAWSDTAAFAFSVLGRIEDEVGFLPAPITRLDRYRSLPSNTERTRYAVATIYHTAYVMGLLCAVLLGLAHRQASASLRIEAHAGIDFRAHLGPSDLLRPDGQAPHWLTDFARLDPAGQAALAPMALTIALQRACARHDFADIRSILGEALRAGAADVPAVQQAAGLLCRVAMVSLG